MTNILNKVENYINLEETLKFAAIIDVPVSELDLSLSVK